MIHQLIKKGTILLMGLSTFAYAEIGSVQITSPTEGAYVKKSLKVDYDVVPGPKGDHVHMYTDGKQVDVIKTLKGEYTFQNLKAGRRELCIKVVDKGHTPIGVEKCVHVNVE